MSAPCILATGRNRAPAFAANLVVYYPLGGDGGEPNNLCIVESNAEMVARENLTISLYTVSCDARSRHGPTQYNIRKNEANGGPAISVASGLNGFFQDNVTIMGLMAGDRYCQSMTYDTNTGTATNNWTSTLVTGMTKKPGGFFQQMSQQSGAFTRYAPFAGSNGMVFNSTEASMQLVAQGAITISNFYVYVEANTHINATVCTVRKNGAPGNGTVSIPANTTGAFEDTTHTDVLADLDKYCWQFIALASGNITFGQSAALITAYPDGFFGLNMSAEGGAIGSLSPDLTGRFSYMVGGLASNGNSFVSQNGIYMPASGVSKNFWINIVTNPSTTAVAINFFRNNIQGNQAISIGAGLTGVFRDTTNSDAFSVGDQLLYNVGFSTTGQPTASTGGSKALFYNSVIAGLGISAGQAITQKSTKVGTASLAVGSGLTITSKASKICSALLATFPAIVSRGLKATSVSAALHAVAQLLGDFVGGLTKPVFPTELMPFTSVCKAASDVLYHNLDWSTIVPPGHRIVLAGAWDQSGAVQVSSETFTGLVQTIEISGGDPCIFVNILIMRIMTEDGQNFSRALQVLVK